MRPFRDGTHGFARMVRDVARQLQKDVRMEIAGLDTPVDREILDRLEAPLGHLLRNALDHGIESPSERLAANKSAEGVIRVEARHSAGQLLVTVADDGRGISIDQLRRAVIDRNLLRPDSAARLSESELLEFLFLPGFTLKESITDISGRGVGLDVVQDMVKKVRGSVRITTRANSGTRFQLHLPLTLSVVRTLLVQIAGEPYAMPLSQITRTARVAVSSIEHLEGRPHFAFAGRATGLVDAARVIGDRDPIEGAAELSVVVIGTRDRTYGLVVERLLGECELVVHTLDPRLGKVPNVSAAAVMEDGSPVLILDVDDLVRSIEKLVIDGALSRPARDVTAANARPLRRVLVVDDSLTVRELQRKVLVNGGYEVEVATDGMDGWNAVRAGKFDLVITDIDMPRLDGIELVTLIRKDPHVKNVPVMIVSYKDRAEDRRRGLDAGADHYLAKGSFHDAALLEAVRELVGEAVS
jgi:two-component system sensor histidine kinase and response regulator WspE